MAAAQDGRSRCRPGCSCPASMSITSRPRCSRWRCRARWRTPILPACARSSMACRRSSRELLPLVEAMCASLAGEPESAAAQIDSARRRGRVGGIDLVLAEKVVGAGADTGRAVTVEWEPVDRLNSWRYGLATATGMAPPDRLLRSATSAGAGVAGTRALAVTAGAAGIGADRHRPRRLFVAVADRPLFGDLRCDRSRRSFRRRMPGSCGWRSSAGISTRGSPPFAGFGRSATVRSSAKRRGRWSPGPRRRIAPDAEVQEDAPKLIASMLAAGYDREAARWAGRSGG